MCMSRAALIIHFRTASRDTEMRDYQVMMTRAADELEQQICAEEAVGRVQKGHPDPTSLQSSTSFQPRWIRSGLASSVSSHSGLLTSSSCPPSRVTGR